MTAFVSHLAPELDAFLAFKRAMGHPYLRAEFTLRDFDRFVLGHAREHRPFRMEDAVLAWLASKPARKAVSVTVELGVVRQFCLHRRRRDPAAFVPGRIWAPQSTQSEFLPFVFTKAQVVDLLRRAGSVDWPCCRGVVLRALLLVLYCTGLRVGEALRLRMKDVRVDDGVMFIAESKGRARWVPFDRSLARELDRYLTRVACTRRSDPTSRCSSAAKVSAFGPRAPATRFGRYSVPPDSSRRPDASGRGRTTSDTRSRCTVSRAGTAPASTSTRAFPGCRHTWATTTSSAPRPT